MAIKVYTSVAKGLKAKVRKFWGLINMSVEVTREKLIGCVGVGGGVGLAWAFLLHAHPE